MFDNFIDKAFEKALPKTLDLGSFDKAISWLRDSAWFCSEAAGSDGLLRDNLCSWIDFLSECDGITIIHIYAFEAYARVLFFELTGKDFDFTAGRIDQIKEI